MKKIRVYELAKNRNLSNHEVIEMLQKKGLKKVSAITYVDPTILDGNVKSGKAESAGAKISHLFGKPSTSNLAAARAVELKPVKARKKAAAKKDDAAAAAPAAAKQKTEKKQVMTPKKEGPSVAALAAIAISIVALLAVAYTFSGLNSGMARVEKLSTDLQASINRLDNTVTNNSGQLLDMQKDITTTNRQIDEVRDMTFSSQLKSQSAVLSVISTQLPEPLRSKTKRLADNLAAF